VCGDWRRQSDSLHEASSFFRQQSTHAGPPVERPAAKYEIFWAMKSWIQQWLGVEQSAAAEPHGALRELLDALERLAPDRARYLAQFAYLLGRVAHADQHVTPAETRAMEQLIEREGAVPPDQAMLVVGLAKTSNLLFGGTENFIVAREFAATASYEQKLALARCLFVVSAAEGNISIEEEREIQRIARELRIEPADVVDLRLQYRNHLPGLSKPRCRRSSPPWTAARLS
jgi:uncharacterized tellurite resistance protein B-like protein